ncbi:unnamed protein product [Kuraishia capsulata CBS 1993]|uniref:Partial AB-hydrolase lipase domain-containing protein n=1 Tax=Kuraishia capsulata CBS 1993 TaxID=1382522 RepID=W6MXF5_9ASCO|nr:uncharacterized protein KUCA_T00004785001 [Kuraishia capsulata CBS 1993]CDK28800.1 unnamed protein product [Kuraishia capsulata CBS 1993]
MTVPETVSEYTPLNSRRWWILRISINLLLSLVVTVVQLPMYIYHCVNSLLFSASQRRQSPDNITKFMQEEIVAPLFDSSSTEGSNELETKIVEALDIVDIVHLHGYKVHEHVVQTRDGYLLAIHRIVSNKVTPSTIDLRLSGKKVVYLHHGLLTNSEIFVLGDTKEKCLPFLLVDLGFDVWLGNNRGNKYSRKHISLSPNSNEFWDYSLDQFAMFDIPDTVSYILGATKREKLAYIGFSQGSAQCLAALSLSPKLGEQIELFIGLSPAMIPQGLCHPLTSLFVYSAPSFMFRLFGKRAILPSVVFWQRIFGPALYEQVVDRSLIILFGWKSKNLSKAQKTVGYPHIFSPTSVKSVIHWFQIISSGRFQMYDEGGAAGSKLVPLSGSSTKTHRVAPFPIQTISTPMLLIYGEADSLIDMVKTRDNLSCPCEVVGIPSYEHMDTLWADDVNSKVFDRVINRLMEPQI